MSWGERLAARDHLVKRTNLTIDTNPDIKEIKSSILKKYITRMKRNEYLLFYKMYKIYNLSFML